MDTNKILNFFARYIDTELGIIYAEHNYFQLQNRLDEIAEALGKDNLETLYNEAQNGINGQFKQALLDSATNNETSFFRDEKVFLAIEKRILNLVPADFFKTQCFKVWSAACSTGQEPISLAILIQEYAEKTNTRINFKIIGSDISERVLNKAKEGSYSLLEINRGLTDALKLKYFTQNSKLNWVSSPDIKSHLEFRSQNLKHDFSALDRFHLVFCRNVLIYQDVESKTEILTRITNSFYSGGYLVLGSGESLLGLSQDYEQHFIDGAVIYQKK